MFVDRIKVYAQAGSGGRGCVSFRREKFVPKGGPDGGDGGRGGDVILRADVHVDNLSNLFYEPIIKAKNGGHGMGKKMHGRGAVPKVVKVPIGTMVYRDETDGPVEPKPIADLTHDGEEFVLCEGGKGGKGNVHFKSPHPTIGSAVDAVGCLAKALRACQRNAVGRIAIRNIDDRLVGSAAS